MVNFLDVSIQRINTLDPRLIPSATRVFEKCVKQRIPIYIVWGYRTLEQQDTLFRLGRTIPGPIQTIRRASYSAHNYRLALDYCLLYGTQLMSWDEVYPRKYWRNKWLKVMRYFEEEGWESGWRWPSFEPGHVENLMGKSIYDYARGNLERF